MCNEMLLLVPGIISVCAWIAEFENVSRCSSFQHPQLQQPPYMMTAGAGERKYDSSAELMSLVCTSLQVELTQNLRKKSHRRTKIVRKKLFTKNSKKLMKNLCITKLLKNLGRKFHKLYP